MRYNAPLHERHFNPFGLAWGILQATVVLSFTALLWPVHALLALAESFGSHPLED